MNYAYGVFQTLLKEGCIREMAKLFHRQYKNIKIHGKYQKLCNCTFITKIPRLLQNNF